MSKTDATDLTRLLPHAAWARRLARALVSSGDADDLCQEAWLKALERPSFARQPRAWLATVLRHIGHNRFRGEGRRRIREGAVDPPEASPTPEQSLGRMEIQRLLAERVATLDEPFRQTLLLRYFDGLSAAAIARRLSIPAGTVRWRLTTALERLRADLDINRPEWRRDWALLLVPTGSLPSTSLPLQAPPASSSPAVSVSSGIATFPILVAALIALGGLTAAVGWHTLSTLPPSFPIRPDSPRGQQVPGTSPGSQVPPVPGTSPAVGRGEGELQGGGGGEPGGAVTAALDELPLAFEGLPSALVQAFLASQDRRFFEHEGVDLHAMARAFFANVERGDLAAGGSTITQQLAKLSLGPERTFFRKLRQVAIAHELERRYNKREILAMYLDRVFLGHGAFGVRAAARRYFGKEVAQLDVGECALLAGIAHAPVINSPIEHPEAARARRNRVLDQMVGTRALTREQANRWASLPLSTS
jgi:RNA polymerase sigma factor (sigma-70 family)